MCQGENVWGRSALFARGMSRHTLEANLAAGSLRRIRIGVYATPWACDDVLAAAMHGGSLACTSAARHAGLWVLATPGLHVWVGQDGHPRDHPGCECTMHWTQGRPGRSFTPPTVVEVLLQMLGCAGAEAFFAALESALRQHKLSRDDLHRLARRLNRPGRALVRFASGSSDSGLESLFRLRLRAWTARMRQQAAIPGVGRVDFLIDGWLIVELDGDLGHDDASSRRKDLARDVRATVQGYTTLRFTYAMIVHEWPLVEAAVVTALLSRA